MSIDRIAALHQLLDRGWYVDRVKGDGSADFSVVLRRDGR